MTIRIGAANVSQVKVGAANVSSIRIGSTLVWSATGIRDDFDRQDTLGLGSQWTDLGPAVTPSIGSVTNRMARLNLSDELETLALQTSRWVYNAAVSPADDGWLETLPMSAGDYGLPTVVWRRANATLTHGVGIWMQRQQCAIVSRIASVEVIRTSLLDFQPGNILRMTQAGNVHTLTVRGITTAAWDDTGALAASGPTYRSMGMSLSGSKISSTKGGETYFLRNFSPAVDYVECS